MQETTVLRGRGTKEALLKDTTITLLCMVITSYRF
jgi:hypothetical protein